jgi:hypothetical protein
VPRTNASYLRWNFGRWAKQWVRNIVMLDASDSGEQLIAEIALTSGASPIVVTDSRLMQDGRTLLRYEDLRCCFWIDRNPALATKLKHSHFQRMILERTDGTEFVLDGLGQAVFPLLQFFWIKLRRQAPAER